MAKFHGFEIKNMKTFMGMEGYGTQGTVYLNGKKLCFWSNDGNGGEDRFDLPFDAKRKLDALCADQIPECALTLPDGDIMPADLSLVLAHLADLKDLEKDWKKGSNKGYSLVELIDIETDESAFYQIKSTNRTDITRWLVKYSDEEVAKLGFGETATRIYTSEENFDIGEPLYGVDEIFAEVKAWNKKRKEFFENIDAA